VRWAQNPCRRLRGQTGPLAPGSGGGDWGADQAADPGSGGGSAASPRATSIRRTAGGSVTAPRIRRGPRSGHRQDLDGEHPAEEPGPGPSARGSRARRRARVVRGRLVRRRRRDERRSPCGPRGEQAVIGQQGPARRGHEGGEPLQPPMVVAAGASGHTGPPGRPSRRERVSSLPFASDRRRRGVTNKSPGALLRAIRHVAPTPPAGTRRHGSAALQRGIESRWSHATLCTSARASNHRGDRALA
jgi:hypothetical protein